MGADRARDDDGAMTENAHSQPGSQQTASEQPGPGQQGPPPPPPSPGHRCAAAATTGWSPACAGGLGRYTDVDPWSSA